MFCQLVLLSRALCKVYILIRIPGWLWVPLDAPTLPEHNHLEKKEMEQKLPFSPSILSHHWLEVWLVPCLLHVVPNPHSNSHCSNICNPRHCIPGTTETESQIFPTLSGEIPPHYVQTWLPPEHETVPLVLISSRIHNTFPSTLPIHLKHRHLQQITFHSSECR